VHIFTILLPQKGCQMNSATQEEAQALAHRTGGEHYSACSAADLDKWYQDIAQKLIIYAGANTTMGLDFQTVKVDYNNQSTDYPGSEVFAYVYQNDVSTRITSWNATYPQGLPDKLPVPPYPATAIPAPVNGFITYPYSLDQTQEWNASNHLSFYVGNVTIGQTWQASFMLRALKPGTIDLFGNASQICYATDLGETCVRLPRTHGTAEQNITNATRDQVRLDIIDDSITVTPTQSTELIMVGWELNYTGANTVRQRIYYQFSGDGATWDGNWIQFASNITGGHPLDHESYTANMDVRDMVGYVRIRIFSYEIPLGGASDEEETDEAIPVGMGQKPNIRIS
jgi:hypothetical protein